MNQILLPTLLLSMFITAVIPAHAQLDRLRRKIERKLEDKTVEKAEEVIWRKIEDAIESDDDSTRTTESEVRTNEEGEIVIETTDEEDNTHSTVTIGPDEVPENIKPSSFIGSFKIVSSEYKNGKETSDSPQTIEYHFDTYQTAIFTKSDKEAEETIFIMDRAKRKIITKSTTKKEKTATILPMMKVNVEVEEETISNQKYSVEPTGRSERIQGYLAKEYKVETEEGSGTMWASEEVPVNMAELFDFITVKNNQSGGLMNYSQVYGVEGTVLKYDFEHQNGERNIFNMTDIEQGTVNTEIFSTAGYEVQDLSRFMKK